MTMQIGEILPGKKLDPWSPGMEEYLPDGSDVIITREASSSSWAVLTLNEWHSGETHCWYVHKDNIRLKGPVA